MNWASLRHFGAAVLYLQKCHGQHKGQRYHRLPTYELPTGKQFRGRQFMVHQKQNCLP